MWRCAVWSINTNISEDTLQIQAVEFHSILLRETLKMYEVWNFNSGNYLFTTDTK